MVTSAAFKIKRDSSTLERRKSPCSLARFVPRNSEGETAWVGRLKQFTPTLKMMKRSMRENPEKIETVQLDFKDDETIDARETPESIEAIQADFKDDETIDARENQESIEAVQADFKDAEKIDVRKNPESIEAVQADFKDDKTIE